MEEVAFGFLLLVESAAGALVCVFGFIAAHADFMVFIFFPTLRVLVCEFKF